MATKPRYDVFVVREFDAKGEKKSQFVRVGVAFPLNKKRGVSVQLDALPVDGKLVIILHEDKARDA
jgi:hypothetical protein